MPSEELSVVKNCRPPSDWPQQGCVTFSNVKMRYRPNLPLVLKSVSFVIKPKEKIGILSRLHILILFYFSVKFTVMITILYRKQLLGEQVRVNHLWWSRCLDWWI
jgi:ABC-type transport system involved in Fe-S cluster assembly fused permease/ATPase subunit